MEQLSLIARYISAKHALTIFTNEIPNALDLPDNRQQKIKDTAYKMGHLMITNFFTSDELIYIHQEMTTEQYSSTIESHADIYELINRYDRLTQTLEMITDAMLFKFQYGQIKSVIHQASQSFIASFFREDELRKIQTIKKHDTTIIPCFQDNYTYQKY